MKGDYDTLESSVGIKNNKVIYPNGVKNIHDVWFNKIGVIEDIYVYMYLEMTYVSFQIFIKLYNFLYVITSMNELKCQEINKICVEQSIRVQDWLWRVKMLQIQCEISMGYFFRSLKVIQCQSLCRFNL